MQGGDCAPLSLPAPALKLLWGAGAEATLPPHPRSLRSSWRAPSPCASSATRSATTRPSSTRTTMKLWTRSWARDRSRYALRLLGIFSPNVGPLGARRLGWEGCSGVVPGVGDAWQLRFWSGVQGLWLGVEGSKVGGTKCKGVLCRWQSQQPPPDVCPPQLGWKDFHSAPRCAAALGGCGEGVGTHPREGSEREAPRPSLPAVAVPLCHHLPPLCLHQPLLWQRGFPGQRLSRL